MAAEFKLTCALVVSLLLISFSAISQESWQLISFENKTLQEMKDTPVKNLNLATNILVLESLKHQYSDLPMSYQKFKSKKELPANACVINMIKTPTREKTFYFSQPIHLFLSHRLYQKAHLPPIPNSLLDKEGAVTSLPALFSNASTNQLLYDQERSYGTYLDKQLKAIAVDNRANIQFNYDLGTHLKVFAHHSIDYLLDYPNEVNEIVSLRDKTRNYRISGNEPYTLGYFMCKKTPLGTKIIKQINQVLSKIYQHSSFKHAHLDWIANHQKAEVTQYFDKVFLHTQY